MDTILFEIGRRLIPFIQIFGIYVILNGHLSPGGGFAGGTILGVSLILKGIIGSVCQSSVCNSSVCKMGEAKSQYSSIISVMGAALGLYCILKGYSFITGGAELHVFDIPVGTAGRILSGGLILPLNIIIGTVVCLTIYTLYTLFDKGEV